ncbi:MAG: LpxI family protein [Candidatus Brocadiaceae bacterium]|nr:LpxI family protein [Candidatus Brocadiaceae bacterium]
MERLGLIAGNGRFPILFAQSAKARGINIIAVAIEGEASPEIEQYVEKLHWVGVAKMGKLIRTLKSEHIEKAVMAGGLTKSHIHSRFKHLKLRPDMRALNMWYKKLRSKHDHSILEAVANELAIDGIELISSLDYVGNLLAEKGCLTKRKPSESEAADIDFGWKIAKEVAGMEIGQCIVVKDKIVLAVEAIEGTNETIKRGGVLGRGKVVVIKLSKKGQDPRFDVPTIGTETIDCLKEAGVSTLAIEAKKTLVLDKEDTVKLADKYKISIVAL